MQSDMEGLGTSEAREDGSRPDAVRRSGELLAEAENP